MLSLALLGILAVLTAGLEHDEPAIQYPNPKLWWAKRITPDIYVAGSLTERMVKYAGEAGFKSIISVMNLSENRTIGSEIYPSRPLEQYIAETYYNMYYRYIMPDCVDLEMIEVTLKMAEYISEAPRPLLVHCRASPPSTFHTLGAFAKFTRENPNFTPAIRTEEWLNLAASFGLDMDDFFRSGPVYDVIANITGEPKVTSHPKPDITLPQVTWKNSDVTPVYKNWYVAGAFTDGLFLERFSKVPMKRVINVRQGQDAGETPEEVTLLNVADNTGKNRQTVAELQENRLDPGLPPAYVDWDSDVNYEKMNPTEFGDENGYNEKKFRDFITEKFPEVKYLHTPFDEDTVDMEIWNKYKDDWMDAEDTDTLVISRDGSRAMITALLGVGKQEGFSASWALDRAKFLGFDFEENRPDVVALFWEVLGEGMFPAGSGACQVLVSAQVVITTTLMMLKFVF